MVCILIECAPNLLFLFSCLVKSSFTKKKRKKEKRKSMCINVCIKDVHLFLPKKKKKNVHLTFFIFYF